MAINIMTSMVLLLNSVLTLSWESITSSLKRNTITPSLVPIGIGGNPKIENTSMDSYANVEFQNILVYDRALTENEVMRNYQADMAKY